MKHVKQNKSTHTLIYKLLITCNNLSCTVILLWRPVENLSHLIFFPIFVWKVKTNFSIDYMLKLSILTFWRWKTNIIFVVEIKKERFGWWYWQWCFFSSVLYWFWQKNDIWRRSSLKSKLSLTIFHILFTWMTKQSVKTPKNNMMRITSCCSPCQIITSKRRKERKAAKVNKH